MHRESMLNKLYAWRKIEYLTPHQIHSKEISHRLMKEEDVPWVYNNQPDLIKMNNNTIHIVYLGVFKIQEIIKVIKEYLTDDKYVPEESNERTAFAEIKVTHAGQYVEGSFSLSTVPFGIGLFIQKGDAVFYESDWKSEFEEKHDKMVGYVETVLKSGVTVEHLHKIIDKMVDLMGWQPFKSKTIWSKASKSRHHARSGKKETPLKSTSKSDDEIGILNSFYIQDLEKVIDAVHRGDMGQGLARYLSGNKMTAESRIDVDLNQSFLTETLSPSEIPLARWPDKDTHTLNLMQQVAVNLALQERTPNNRLFSINGPPGTGKTTLLREIIANNVVNRASKLIQFSNPNNAFKKVKTITLSSGYSIHISQLDQALCGYSMVVASSNNNAVENVSAELPGLKSIAESYRDHPGADYFRGVATNLFASDSWGLISAPLGNSQNRKTFIDKCWFGNNPNTLKNILYTRNVTIHDWKKACRRFEEALTEVNNEKQKVIKLQQQVNRLQEVRENIKKKEKQLALLLRDERLSLEKYKEKERELDHYRAENHSRSMWKKVLSFLRSLRAKTRIKKELKGLKESISYIKQSIEKETKEKKELCEEKKELEQTIQASKITVIDQDFWNKTYHEIQNSSPWVTKSLTQARVNLFLEAMHVHEVFIQYTKSKLRGCLDGFVNLNSGELKNHPDVIQPIWDALFLVVPVISTTFASIGNMFKGLEKESLGWLFIDEAGQAIPQAAVGAIWRAKHTIVVGDPFQIQPVVTIPNSIIADIAQRYHVSSDDVSVSSSVQTIADRANYYGKKMRNEDGNWIGVPLWVHRRCINPMFTISNCISYDGNMVLATAKPNHSFDYIGDSCWFDVKGKAQPKHYVPEQGQVVMQLLKKCWIYQIKQHELRKSSGFRFPKVYVISPFKSVVKELKKNIRLEFNALGKQSGVKAHEFHQWINESIGTVHTFQGKETDIVIFCLGVDQSHVKAAQWAVKTANLLNVAVSRAKYRFYIVGDYALWGQMNYMNEAARELDYIKVHHTSQLVR